MKLVTKSGLTAAGAFLLHTTIDWQMLMNRTPRLPSATWAVAWSLQLMNALSR